MYVCFFDISKQHKTRKRAVLDSCINIISYRRAFVKKHLPFLLPNFEHFALFLLLLLFKSTQLRTFESKIGRNFDLPSSDKSRKPSVETEMHSCIVSLICTLFSHLQTSIYYHIFYFLSIHFQKKCGHFFIFSRKSHFSPYSPQIPPLFRPCF